MSRAGEVCYLKKYAKVFKNSTVKYYDDGAKFFSTQKNALLSAKNFIFLEFFIVRSGQTLTEIIDILCKKAKSGVKVYFLYDAIGSFFRIKRSDLVRLKKSGVKIQKFSPISPFTLASANCRDHRKIIVVDNKIAFTGGINLSDEYVHRDSRYGFWKDSGLSIVGDAVPYFSEMFLDLWNKNSSLKLDIIYKKSSAEKKLRHSTSTTAIFCSVPRRYEKNRVASNIYLNAINSAKKSLTISTPYLVCSHEIINSLALAAARGVKVRLITPRISDKPLVFKHTRSNYDFLIRHGVEIYEFLPGIIHCKSLVKDGRVAISGTINLDYRSFDIDYECAVWTTDKKFIRSLTKDFIETIKRSERISLGAFPAKSPIIFLSHPLKKQF